MSARAAGVVLAGGRSARMGADKAGLAWGDTTLAAHACATLAGALDGPVVVVRAAGQALPALPPGVLVAEDPAPGRGPLQGIAAGLAAAAGAGAPVAFVTAVDMPFLHAASVAAVLAALRGQDDVALPRVGGHDQTLAAAYRTALAPLAQELVDAGELRPAALFARARVRRLAEIEVPHAGSLRSLDTPEDYAAAVSGGAPASSPSR